MTIPDTNIVKFPTGEQIAVNSMGLDLAELARVDTSAVGLDRNSPVRRATTATAEAATKTKFASHGFATVTQICSNATLNKSFFVGADGKLAKTTAALMKSGEALVRRADTAEALANVIRGLDPVRGALTLGVLPDKRVRAQIAVDAVRRDGQISRTQEFFGLAHDGAGWMMLDIDLGGAPKHVIDKIQALGGIVGAVEHIMPELPGIARVIKPSSSGGVHIVGQQPSALTGMHIFVQLEHAAETHTTLRALAARCWSAGLAWHQISKSGSLLERSLVDLAVGGSERLVFTADPHLGEGVTKTAPEIQAHEGEALGVIEPDDWSTSEAIRVNDRALRDADASAQRILWMKERVEYLVKTRGVSREEAARHVLRLVSDRQLDDSNVLTLADGTEITVAEALDEVESRVNSGDTGAMGSFASPTEGVEYGSDKFIIYGGNNEVPRAIDYSHGGKAFYTFTRYTENTPDGTETKPQRQARETKRKTKLATEPVRLKATVSVFVQNVCEEVGIRATLKAKYDAARAIESDEASSAADRARRRRAIQKDLKIDMGLTALPTTSRKIGMPTRDALGRTLDGSTGYVGNRQWGHQKREHLTALGLGFGHIEELSVPRKVMISGSQGIGKTAAVVGALARADAASTLICAPSNQMSDQVTQDLNAEIAKLEADGFYAQRAILKPLVFRRLGRAALTDEGDPLCVFNEAASTVARAGLSVLNAMCKECPIADMCAHRGQEEAIASALEDGGRAVVVVGDHTHAFMPLPDGKPADALIVDESIRDLGTDRWQVKVSQFAKLPDLKKSMQDENETEQDRDNRDRERFGSRRSAQFGLRHIAKALSATSPIPVLAELSKSYPAHLLRDLATYVGISSEQGLSNDISGLLHSAGRDAAKAADTIGSKIASHNPYPYARVAAMLRLLALEIDVYAEELSLWGDVDKVASAQRAKIEELRQKSIALVVAGDPVGSAESGAAAAALSDALAETPQPSGVPVGVLLAGDGKAYQCYSMKRIAHDGAVLYLDGTGDIDLAVRVFPGIEERVFEVPRNIRVTKINGRSSSKLGLLGAYEGANGEFHGGMKDVGIARNTRAGLTKAAILAAETRCIDMSKVLIGGPKGLADLFRLEEGDDTLQGMGAKLMHYGAIRGRNDAEQCEIGIVAGVLRVPYEGILDVARCLRAGHEVDCGIRVDPESDGRFVYDHMIARDGTTYETRDARFACSWMGAVHHAQATAELAQTVDRLRCIFNGDTKEVFLMTDVLPSGLVPDATLTWAEFVGEETVVDRAIAAAGFFVESERECARILPGVVSKKAARLAVGKLSEFEEIGVAAGAGVINPEAHNSEGYKNKDLGPVGLLRPSWFVESSKDEGRNKGNHHGWAYSRLSYKASPEPKEGDTPEQSAVRRGRKFTALFPAHLSLEAMTAALEMLYAALGRSVSDVQLSAILICPKKKHVDIVQAEAMAAMEAEAKAEHDRIAEEEVTRLERETRLASEEDHELSPEQQNQLDREEHDAEAAIENAIDFAKWKEASRDEGLRKMFRENAEWERVAEELDLERREEDAAHRELSEIIWLRDVRADRADTLRAAAAADLERREEDAAHRAFA